MSKASFQMAGLTASDSHDISLLVITLFNAILYIAVVFINISSTQPSIGIFTNSTDAISKGNEVGNILS
jgi:hypothetical protein